MSQTLFKTKFRFSFISATIGEVRKTTGGGEGFSFLYKVRELRQICPEMHANQMQSIYNIHHKVSSHIKVHQNTPDSVRHEVISK